MTEEPKGPEIPDPEPKVVRWEESLPPVKKMPELQPLVKAMRATPEGSSFVDRVRAVWTVIEPFTEGAIRTAEAIYGPGTGTTKKAVVQHQLMTLLRHAEGRVDLVPDWLEPIVFKGLQIASGPLIERLLGGLKAKGLIPA